MKLYFRCPQTKETFASDDYSLQRGYEIVEDDGGEKELQGIVSVNSGCPFCGEKHLYAAKDVICPLSGGSDEE